MDEKNVYLKIEELGEAADYPGAFPFFEYTKSIFHDVVAPHAPLPPGGR